MGGLGGARGLAGARVVSHHLRFLEFHAILSFPPPCFQTQTLRMHSRGAMVNPRLKCARVAHGLSKMPNERPDERPKMVKTSAQVCITGGNRFESGV